MFRRSPDTCHETPAPRPSVLKGRGHQDHRIGKLVGLSNEYQRNLRQHFKSVNRVFINGLDLSYLPDDVITGNCETVPVQRLFSSPKEEA